MALDGWPYKLRIRKDVPSAFPGISGISAASGVVCTMPGWAGTVPNIMSCTSGLWMGPNLGPLSTSQGNIYEVKFLVDMRDINEHEKESLGIKKGKTGIALTYKLDDVPEPGNTIELSVSREVETLVERTPDQVQGSGPEQIQFPLASAKQHMRSSLTVEVEGAEPQDVLVGSRKWVVHGKAIQVVSEFRPWQLPTGY